MVAPTLAEMSERAADYATRASGPGTQAAYRSAWKAYMARCGKIGREPLSGDPGLLALYLIQRADYASPCPACRSPAPPSVPPTVSPASRSTSTTRGLGWSWRALSLP